MYQDNTARDLTMNNKLENLKSQPYYIQIKNVLKEKIKSGKISNKKLPSIRQVAKDFSVSVNTVLRAYNELSKEGIVTGSVGRGTYISITPKKNNSTSKEAFISISPQTINKENRKDFLTRIIQVSLEEALSLDFSLEEFEEAVTEYVKEKLELMQRIKLVFIECNIEQLTYFTNHLELDPNINLTPVLFEELNKQKSEVMKEIEGSDVVVTSFYHLDEVHKHLDHLGKKIIGINLQPEVSTIVEIAKVRPENVVGIITTSKTFIEIIKEILKDLKLNFKEIVESNSKDEETIKQLVHKCDAVLVSPRRKNVVTNCANEHTKVIEFVFTPDRTSINNLKVTLLEVKKSLV